MHTSNVTLKGYKHEKIYKIKNNDDIYITENKYIYK